MRADTYRLVHPWASDVTCGHVMTGGIRPGTAYAWVRAWYRKPNHLNTILLRWERPPPWAVLARVDVVPRYAAVAAAGRPLVFLNLTYLAAMDLTHPVGFIRGYHYTPFPG